jgi:hypothetical protein
VEKPLHMIKTLFHNCKKFVIEVTQKIGKMKMAKIDAEESIIRRNRPGTKAQVTIICILIQKLQA